MDVYTASCFIVCVGQIAKYYQDSLDKEIRPCSANAPEGYVNCIVLKGKQVSFLLSPIIHFNES